MDSASVMLILSIRTFAAAESGYDLKIRQAPCKGEGLFHLRE